MKYAIMVLALVGILATPRLAVAANWDGNEMLEFCRGDLGKTGVWTCNSYVKGWLDAFIVATSARYNTVTWRNPFLEICIDKGVTAEQAAKVILKYLENHPEHLHYNGAMVVHYALKKAFPC